MPFLDNHHLVSWCSKHMYSENNQWRHLWSVCYSTFQTSNIVFAEPIINLDFGLIVLFLAITFLDLSCGKTKFYPWFSSVFSSLSVVWTFLYEQRSPKGTAPFKAIKDLTVQASLHSALLNFFPWGYVKSKVYANVWPITLILKTNTYSSCYLPNRASTAWKCHLKSDDFS